MSNESEKETIELSAIEANQMLEEKTKELIELQKELVDTKEKLVNVTNRALKVHEENQLLQHSPQYAKMAGEMKFHLEMAAKFSASKAFPKYSPEQIYVLIKAGAEMGLKPMESLGSLYIYNGKVEPYGKALSNFITRKGYNIKYTDETDKGVTVTVTGNGFEGSETIDINDPILANKLRSDKNAAIKFAPRQKKRFHALRMLLNFQLPHLISAVSDLFEASTLDMIRANENHTQLISKNDSVQEMLNVAKNLDEVLKIESDNLSTISKSITLARIVKEAKEKFNHE